MAYQLQPLGALGDPTRRAIFERLAAAIPVPKGELEYINPYTLLVAVVLSAQATDKGVNKATEPHLPMILIPTTSGTGSEAQSFALISDATTHQKMACGDRRLPVDGGLRPRSAAAPGAETANARMGVRSTMRVAPRARSRCARSARSAPGVTPTANRPAAADCAPTRESAATASTVAALALTSPVPQGP